MVGPLTTREKFDFCVMLGISKEAHFSFVNCPEICKAFPCIHILESCERFLY